jgi:exopolysaccharide production protein ExoQ
MVEVLVALACYLSFFANVGSIGTLVQVAALGLLFAAAALAVLQNKVNASPVTLTELTMYAVGVVSTVLGMLSTEVGPLIYSVGFLGAVILVSIVARSLSLERLLDIGAAVMLLCVLTTLVVERGNALTALSISVGRTGLLRFTPLGSHPNLTGYMFGAGSILLIRRVLISKNTFERIVMAGAAFLSWAFVLAASARSSILALFVAAAVAIILERRVSRAIGWKWIAIGVVTVAIIGLAFTDKITSYVVGMLELESSTRGMSSGGSGRVDIWWHGLATLFDDPLTLIFGGGFRSSSSDVIGFSTESSYVTILLDNGIFIGCAVIFVFWCSPIRALRLSLTQSPQANTLVLVCSFLTFLLIESIFNRYLLAVGNPTSLMTLPILFSLAMRGRSTNGQKQDGVLGTWPSIEASSGQGFGQRPVDLRSQRDL